MGGHRARPLGYAYSVFFHGGESPRVSPLGLIDLPSPTHHHNRKSAFAISFDNRYQTCQLLVIFADGDEAPAVRDEDEDVAPRGR